MNIFQLVQLVADAGVDFVIAGGWSAVLHGSAHVPFHLELCCSRDAENIRRLAGALTPHSSSLGPTVWNQIRDGKALAIPTDLGLIDLLPEVAGVGDYDEVLAHSLVVRAFGREVKTLDLSALIQSQRAAGRPWIVPELECLLDICSPA